MKKTVQRSVALLFLLAIFFVQTANCDDAKDAAGSSAESPQGDSKEAAPVKSDEKEQVKAWFAQYDEIRRSAEMSLQEKMQVHFLFSKGLNASSGGREFEKSSKLATTMLARYTEAGDKIKALAELSATTELQKGYVEYFADGAGMFRDFLQYQKESGGKEENKAKLLAKKEEMTALVNKIKAMDAKLRSDFGVKPHRHS